MSCTARRITPAGAGGVAVVELTGEGATGVLAALGATAPEGCLRLAHLREADELLDEALLVGRGRDHFELGLHGGPAVVRAVLAALERNGAVVTDHAATNVEEAAQLALATAPSDRAARILLDQARGALRAAASTRHDWRAIHAAHAHLFVPPRVVLAGPVNVGKSTLFNLLVGTQRTTVSSMEGTTRDAILARGRLGFGVVEWVDTAGERSTGEAVEQEGQDLARRLAEQASLVLWCDPEGGAGPEGSVPIRTRTPDVPVLDDPERALGVVHERVAAALGGTWFEDPWTPGAPVPFTPELAARLEEAWEGDEGERASRLDSILGPSSPLPLL